MDTARIFKSGRSQAVRLPKEYRFKGDCVAVKHLGGGVLLLPLDNPWKVMQEALDLFESDFKLQRDQQAPEIREAIKS